MASTEFDVDQFDEAYPPGIENTWWQLARCAVIERTFQRHVPRSAHILEVGCGTGIVTAHLRANGWNAQGVEIGTPRIGPQAEAYVTLGTNATDLPADQRLAFTALALFDVIEHIADAPAFLRDLLVAFPNARHIIVTVPARGELWTSFDDHFGHFRRYDRPMVRKQFTAAGITMGRASYFFHGLYPAILLNNMIRGRKRNIRFAAPAGWSVISINRVLARFFDLEARIVPGTVVGSSIIAVGQVR